MGIAYNDLENYNEAIQCYKINIRIAQNNTVAYNNMAVAYSKLGKENESIKYLKKAAQLGDRAAQVWLRNNGYSWSS
jgi:tetratricopeptide (TPR) repeat protein